MSAKILGGSDVTLESSFSSLDALNTSAFSQVSSLMVAICLLVLIAL